MSSRVPKHLKLSARTEQIKEQADLLIEQGFYVGSILHYVIYVEQLLLTAYLFTLRELSIDLAREQREYILNKKEEERYPFGKIVRETVPLIQQVIDGASSKSFSLDKTELYTYCDRLRKIRNIVSAHPHFTLMLDPTNRWKRGMYDANFYRKLLRRIRKFIQSEIGIRSPPELDKILRKGHPLTISSRLEDEFITVENSVSRILADYSKKISERVREELRFIIP